MNRVAALLVVVAMLVIIPSPAARAGCPAGTGTASISVTDVAGGFGEAGAHSVQSSDCSTTVTQVSVPGHYEHETVCAYQDPTGCQEPALCPDNVTPLNHVTFVPDHGQTVDLGYPCPTEVAEDPVQITNQMVLRAFERVPLPKSELVVQPPGGETLVNFATNFYTEAGPFERSVTLVGQQVDLRIWPSRFDWVYGDGEQASTTEPGAAYPDLEVTHEYLTAGQVGPSVDTIYSAEFRVNGGAWQPVVGTVTMAGVPVGLQVRTATPTLVGY